LIKIILFDLDDTLCYTQLAYKKARDKFIDFMESLGHDRAETENVFLETEMRNIEQHGFTRDRFGRSMLNTYMFMCARKQWVYLPEYGERARLIGEEPFTHSYELLPNAVEILDALSKHFDLYLYTAGDVTHQQSKIENLTIAPYFKGTFIVPLKNTASLSDILQQLAPATNREVLMVGNSLKADIAPAVALDVPAIWLRTDQWEYDRAADVPEVYTTVADLQHLYRVIIDKTQALGYTETGE
jgi:putative hydrolase of the HAD superfamily